MNRPMHGGNLVWAAQIANCSPLAILDFSASINPLGPPELAIATIQDHLADLRAYPDPNYRQLRTALGQFHNISPECLLPGNGAAELLTWACRDLAALDSTCLLTPAFGDYLRALKAFDAKVERFALGEWEEVGGGISEQPSNLKIMATQEGMLDRVGLLLNNPHNPTGRIFSKESIAACLKKFALVVVDEAFMDFLPPEHEQSLIDLVADHANLVVVRSLTKFYSLPGLRLGYAIAQPERLQRWQQWRDPWSVNALAAAVGEVVVQDQEFQQKTWNWLATAKLKLFHGLAQMPGLQPLPGAANFLLVQSEHSVMELQRELLQRHQILIRDCWSFPELGDRYFRVAVRTDAENQRLLAGLKDTLLPN